VFIEGMRMFRTGVVDCVDVCDWSVGGERMSAIETRSSLTEGAVAEAGEFKFEFEFEICKFEFEICKFEFEICTSSSAEHSSSSPTDHVGIPDWAEGVGGGGEERGFPTGVSGAAGAERLYDGF